MTAIETENIPHKLVYKTYVFGPCVANFEHFGLVL